MTSAEHALLALAAEQFPDLTDAEKKLLRAVAAGDIADYHSPNDAENDSSRAETWDESRTIRAEVIRWLCVDREAIRHIDPKGIRIHAAKINGPLDLQSVTIPFPFELEQCGIYGGVNLLWAETRSLNFEDSWVYAGGSSDPFMGDGLVVHGASALRKGFHAEGTVRLVGATITGDLDCTDGEFRNLGGTALVVSVTTVGGRVLLCEGFRAAGAVWLMRTQITGDLECGKGTFFNPGRTALNAEGIHVGGRVFLGAGFHAEGVVSLVEATGTSNLDCHGGEFHNPGGDALLADAIKVSGQAALGQNFQAESLVSLVGATIARDLNCSRGLFRNVGGTALSVDRIKVGGSAFLDANFRAEGEVRLVGATVTSDLNGSAGVFHNQDGNALSADGLTVGRDVYLRNGFQAKGRVLLPGVNIRGDLDFSMVRSSEMTLNLIGARVGRLIDDMDSWGTRQTFNLDGFVYTVIADAHIASNDRLHWLKLHPSEPFRPQPYQQLAKVLRESGHEADAKRVRIAKEKARRQYGDLGRGAWVANWILGFTMAYGYEPWRLLLGAGFFFLLGWGLFAAGNLVGTMIPTKAEVYTMYDRTHQVPASYPVFSPFMYSLDTLIPAVNFGQKEYWRPRDTRPAPPTPQPSSLVIVAAASSPLSPRSEPAAGVTNGDGRWQFRWRIDLTMIATWLTSGSSLRVYRWVHIGVGWLLVTLGTAWVTGLVRKE